MQTETRLGIEKTFQSKLSMKFPKKGSNVDSLLAWLKYVDSGEFEAAFQKSFSSKGRLSVLATVAHEVIHAEIYQKYPDPGGRTESLLKSFKAVAGTPDDENSGATVFSDITGKPSAPAKSGDMKGQISYASFFEDPVGLNSFIRSVEPLATVRYRPFMDVLTNEVFRAAETNAASAAAVAIKKRFPKGIE